jgi:magnesium chelatase family protein
MPLNYYEILQVSTNAELEVIQAAYRRLAFKYHPDRNSDTSASKAMQELNEAFEVLSDAERRRRYDAIHGFATAANSKQKSSNAPESSNSRRRSQMDRVKSASGVTIRSAILRGIGAELVEIQIAFTPAENEKRGGAFRIVGLAKKAVEEGAVRLAHAFDASGFKWPHGEIVINLAPADIPKEGTNLDLAIALSILASSGQLCVSNRAPIFAIGVLNFDGTLGRCRGALSVGRTLPAGSVLIAPISNRYELGLLHQIQGPGRKDFNPFVVNNLSEAARVAEGTFSPTPKIKAADLRPAFSAGVDFKDVKGQNRAKEALEVAAAGGHNVLLMGPPGEGKSLLAEALPTILPRLTPIEILDLTQIYSAKGELDADEKIVLHRPFRKVAARGASVESVIGGGSPFPLPGALTLAHRGVLFMDELPQFSPGLLDALRQPLEEGRIHLARKGGTAHYPCQIILAAAMNPCPCGFDGEFICDKCRRKISMGQDTCPDCGCNQKTSRCTCTRQQIRRYRSRISGPVMDRIDLTIRVGALTPEEKFGSTQTNEDSQSIRRRVEAARELQRERFQGTPIPVNARIPGGKVDDFCKMMPSALAAMKEVAKRIPEITTRGHDKLLKVARTIADLNNAPAIKKAHIMRAADLCGHDRVKEFLAYDAGECSSCGSEIQTGDKFCRKCGASVATHKPD